MNKANLRLKAVVFDFDGVVINSEPLYESAEKSLFSEFNIKVSEEDWKRFKGISEADFFRLLSSRYQISTPTEIIKKRARSLLLDKFKSELNYMPGFKEFLSEIENRYKIGLVTSTPREIVEWIFSCTDIKNHFQSIVTADDVSKGKPDPEPYLEICRRLNILPEETLVIEDSIHGVKSAVTAGTLTIGFTSSLTKNDLNFAHYYANTFDEIREIIRDIESLY